MFAAYYDWLMEDAPYEAWQTFFLELLQRYSIPVDRIADIGCGTGTMTLFFCERGFEVYAIDPSHAMLTQAINKVKSVYPDQVSFLETDAAHLRLPRPVPIAISFCDAMSYILTEDELEASFVSVFEWLASDGIFVFDMHTLYKIQELYGDSLYVEEADDLTMIWKTHVLEDHVLRHDVTFFEEDETQEMMFRKSNEVHYQKAYEVHTVISILQKIGFSQIEAFADFTWKKPKDQSERYFFVAKKE